MEIKLNGTITFEKTYHAYMATKDDGITKKYRQIVSMGGSRSSKSWSIMQLFLIILCTRENLKITCWRNLKNICRATILEDFQNILQAHPEIAKDIIHNKQSGTFTHKKTKSKIVFEGADSEGKVLGGTQDISFFNEITEMTERVYLQIRQRTRETIFVDYNPSKSFFINKYKNVDNTIFIHSTFLDNYYCPEDIKNDILAYEPWEHNSYDVIEGELYYNGEPITKSNQPPPHKKNVENGTANEFMWVVYGLGLQAEKPNKIYHGWRKISSEVFNNVNRPSYWGIDFGVANPTAVVEVKFLGDNTFYVRKRLYKPLQDLNSSLNTVLTLQIPELTTSDLVVCDSAKQSYIDILTSAGYMAVGALKGGGSLDAGISLMQKMKIFYVDDEDLNNEYDNYSFMTDRNGKSLDKPMQKDDHLMDAIRYIITYLIEYLGIKV